MSAKRIEYIDIAKGIGILLVALAHADISLFSPYLHKFIYSFHMPLFFFLSGYFFNPETPFWTLLKKRFNSILKPYFVTIALIYIASLSFTNMRFMNAFGRILKSLYGTGYYIDWVQLWFLPSLFVTSLFAFIFYRAVLIHIDNRYVRWLILLGVQTVALLFLDRFYPFSISLLGKDYELYGLPFNLDLALLSGFFYIMGNEIRHTISEKIFGNLWILLGTGGALILLTSLFEQRVDFNTRVFESFSINTAEAILGILLALAVSKQIELRTTHLANALKYIGQASLFILIFHVPIQEYWAPKLFFVTEMQALSILSAFVISVLISLGIYRIFFERNPIALFWYGRISSPPKKDKPPTESIQSVEQKFPE
ncbi:MAG: acyltransferase family protein [Anaerolineales bacterium]|jgi:fucose 4-O-acetylase-like acetyltransferase